VIMTAFDKAWSVLKNAGICYDCKEEYGQMHDYMVAMGFCRNYDPNDPEGPKPGEGLEDLPYKEHLEDYKDRGSPVPEPDKERDRKMEERDVDWRELE